MAAVQRLAKQAFITFRTKESPTFSSNLEKLKVLRRQQIIVFYPSIQLDSLTPEDINLTVPNEQSEELIQRNAAPVSHIGIYECPFFSMGIFIIKNGCEIPLHDHPDMYGLCKVLYGKLKIRCYSLVNNGFVPIH
ncbi:hypothetical protein QZH41_017408 [Actinostola sp. cb2023]|nr:hypothetical protein QZH41_015621 [Actinostola sp. cb2023]KAK3750241.1 hypothetical protein QZH41_017408 [Actinostola sp. cb2023]